MSVLDPYYLFLGAISLHFLLSRVLCDDRLADPAWRRTANSSLVVEPLGREAQSELLRRLAGRIDAGNLPLVLGIAGGSGSGKTTLAGAVLQELGDEFAAIITHDSYYRDLSHLALEERAERNFDHPDALDTDLLVRHLRQLKSGVAVQVPRYDFSTHSRMQETVLVSPRPVIVVEGILIFASADLLELLDIKVFVDTEDDLRLARRIERDTSERGRSVQSVLHQYFKSVRPMHQEFVAATKSKADIIVPVGLNSVALDLLVHRLRAAILQHHQTRDD